MNLRFNTALLALALLVPLGASAQLVTIAPPPLPYYTQPPAPGDDYIWTPGYWAWSAAEGDYYWVPGTWVEAPSVGDLWTPGYWAYEGRGFLWHPGYWGLNVGFYGGVNYGYGYGGTGYRGGHWDHRHFVRTAQATSRGPGNSQVSFHGGPGGNRARPPAQNTHARPEEHRAPSEVQMQHEHAAVARPAQRATGAHEHPLVAATPRPSAFEAPGAEHARGGPPPRQPSRPAAPPAARGGQPEHAPQAPPAHHEQEPRREH